MCLPDVDVPDPQTAKPEQFNEASVDGSTQGLLAETKPVFENEQIFQVCAQSEKFGFPFDV